MGTGASYASPHCAGNLADAMVLSTVPGVAPEAAMALMMATAWHNIEGDSRLSAKDGALGIHGLAAVRQARACWPGVLSGSGGSLNTPVAAGTLSYRGAPSRPPGPRRRLEGGRWPMNGAGFCSAPPWSGPPARLGVLRVCNTRNTTAV
jgi:hypothetical protein